VPSLSNVHWITLSVRFFVQLTDYSEKNKQNSFRRDDHKVQMLTFFTMYALEVGVRGINPQLLHKKCSKRLHTRVYYICASRV